MGANHMYEIARRLRKNTTIAERVLWEQLRSRKLDGYKFLRQRPLSFGSRFHGGDFVIADFYCHAARLIIELDGQGHARQKPYDGARDTKLAEMGYRVIRFANEEVLHDMSNVLNRISLTLQGSPPSKEGGAGGGS
jgi:very-short-patch-repair endonuclease